MDEDFLRQIGVWSDISQCLTNLGWDMFHTLGSSYYTERVTKCLTTLCQEQDDDENDYLIFRIKDAAYSIAIEDLTELFGFDVEAPLHGNATKQEHDKFWHCIAIEEECKRVHIQNSII